MKTRIMTNLKTILGVRTLSVVCLFACCLTIQTAQAQTRKSFTLSIWDGTDNTDSDRANAKLYGFLPEKCNGKAVIICPGGGYQGLCMDYEGTDFATWFNEHNIAAFVLSYRLPGGRSAVPLDDATRALTIVRENAALWGIDSQAIGIMGSSAGGHLASTLATHFTTDTRPNFQILLYPVITMDDSYTHAGSKQALLGNSPAASQVVKYSNEKQVKKNTPQAFIVVSAADELVPVKNSLQYTQALITNNIPVSLHIYPGGFHGFGHLSRFEDYEVWHNELLYWMEQEISARPSLPLDTDIDYGNPLLKSTSQLSDNCYWPYPTLDMSVNVLLDGSMTTHFHSDATNTTPLSQLNQYIQMDLMEPQTKVQLYYAGRNLEPIGPVTNPVMGNINSPSHIIIMATNTPDDESSWTQVAEFTDGFPGVVVAGEYFSPAIEMETPMRYLRMVVKAAEQSEVFWNISELQVYPYKVPEQPAFKALYDQPILKETSQLSDNCYWPFATLDMSVNVLLDGSMTTHFHSDATNATPLSQLNQYIQMDMLEPQTMVQLYYAGRNLEPIGPVTNPTMSMINSPNHIIIMATNTPDDESSWTQVAEFTDGFPGIVASGEYYSPAIAFETPMRYLRMVVKGAEQSSVYWNISELQLYPCVPTSIESVEASAAKAEFPAVYSLDGRRVKAESNLRRGVYVVDGKKVLVGN